MPVEEKRIPIQSLIALARKLSSGEITDEVTEQLLSTLNRNVTQHAAYLFSAANKALGGDLEDFEVQVIEFAVHIKSGHNQNKFVTIIAAKNEHLLGLYEGVVKHIQDPTCKEGGPLVLKDDFYTAIDPFYECSQNEAQQHFGNDLGTECCGKYIVTGLTPAHANREMGEIGQRFRYFAGKVISELRCSVLVATTLDGATTQNETFRAAIFLLIRINAINNSEDLKSKLRERTCRLAANIVVQNSHAYDIDVTDSVFLNTWLCPQNLINLREHGFICDQGTNWFQAGGIEGGVPHNYASGGHSDVNHYIRKIFKFSPDANCIREDCGQEIFNMVKRLFLAQTIDLNCIALIAAASLGLNQKDWNSIKFPNPQIFEPSDRKKLIKALIDFFITLKPTADMAIVPPTFDLEVDRLSITVNRFKFRADQAHDDQRPTLHKKLSDMSENIDKKQTGDLIESLNYLTHILRFSGLYSDGLCQMLVLDIKSNDGDGSCTFIFQFIKR